MKRLVVVLALVTLVGCSSAPVPSPSPSGSPTPSAATAQQFASIIAGEEGEWREVIDDAFACRLLWVTGGKSTADRVKGMTCYTREATIVMSTATAAQKIRELTPSSDVTQLVTDTLAALDAISSVDLEGACGKPFSDGSPRDSKKCSTTQGELNQAYQGLKTVLDEWKPYM